MSFDCTESGRTVEEVLTYIEPIQYQNIGVAIAIVSLRYFHNMSSEMASFTQYLLVLAK